jgi:hypothetical protein
MERALVYLIEEIMKEKISELLKQKKKMLDEFNAVTVVVK